MNSTHAPMLRNESMVMEKITNLLDPFNNLTIEEIEKRWLTMRSVFNDSLAESENDEQYINKLPALKIFLYFIYIMIFVIGMLGNALVCYVVIRNKSMQTVTNYFIMNLALSDILLCTFAVPFTPLYLLVVKRWVSNQ